MLQYSQICFDKPLDIAHITSLVRRGKRYGPSFMAGAACAADAMHVIFNVFRKIIVNDKLYADYIYPSGRNIGCDKYPVFASFKAFERFPALLYMGGAVLAWTAAKISAGDAAFAFVSCARTSVASAGTASTPRIRPPRDLKDLSNASRSVTPYSTFR